MSQLKLKQQSLYLELAHIKHNIAPKLGFCYDTMFKYQPKKKYVINVKLGI